MADVPASILTPRQRDYLRADPDERTSGASGRAIRSRIRERLQVAILDLQLIASTLPIEDIDDALSEPDDYEFEPGSMPPFMNSVPALAAILYLATTPEGKEEDIQTFVDRAAQGVKIAVNRRGKTVENHEIEWRLGVGTSLEERAQGDLTEVPEPVLKQLLSSGMITSDQFSEAWLEKQESEE